VAPDPGDPSAHFDPDNDLEVAMLAALTEPKAMPAFLDELADATVLIATLDPVGPRDQRASLRFPVVDLDGRMGVPAYTSTTRLLRARSEAESMVGITGRGLASLWDWDQPLLLNAGAELGIELSADTVRSLGRAPPATDR
jgi:hypothetical protein